MTDEPRVKNVPRRLLKLRPCVPALAVLALALVVDHTPGRLGLDMLDRSALETSERTLDDTAAIFVAARAVNSVVSMARSLTVGVGITVSPGELLDPLDRAVDAVNDALLAGMIAAVTANIVLVAAGHVGLPTLSLLVAVSLMGVTSLAGVQSVHGLLARRLCLIALVTVLVGRLGLPTVVLSADRCAEFIASGRVEQATAELRRLGAPASLFSISPVESPASFETVRAAAAAISTEPGPFVLSLATLAGVTMLRVVVLPLLLIVMLWRLARMLTA
ncbi:MAG: hypothetical protein WCJ64_02480 [Rhodospirillaceae bacterium]